jgi:hypothetical protein
MVVFEAFSRLTGSSPSVLDTRDTALVRGDRPLCRRTGAQYPLMQMEENAEHRHRRQKKPGRGLMANGENETRQANAENGKPGVGQAGIGGAEALVFGAPEVEPPGVFDEGTDHSSPIVLQRVTDGEGTLAVSWGRNRLLDKSYVTVQTIYCSES